MNELFEDLTSIDHKEIFTNREIKIDHSNPKEFNTFYSDGDLEPPAPEEFSALRINIDDDWDLHLHAYSKPEVFSDILDVFEEYLKIVDSANVHHLNLYLELELESLTELGFNYNFGDMSLDAIQLKDEDIQLALSENDGTVRARSAYYGEDRKFEAGELHDFVNNKIDIAFGFIDEVKDV